MSGSPLPSRSRSLVTANPGLANCRRRARKEAAIVALAGVRPADGAATREQAEADQREQSPDDTEDDPPAAWPPRLARRCLRRVARTLAHSSSPPSSAASTLNRMFLSFRSSLCCGVLASGGGTTGLGESTECVRCCSRGHVRPAARSSNHGRDEHHHPRVETIRAEPPSRASCSRRSSSSSASAPSTAGSRLLTDAEGFGLKRPWLDDHRSPTTRSRACSCSS